MITDLLPLSKNKLEFLKSIYEHQPTHLRKVSTDAHIHPYLLKRIVDALYATKIIESTKAGKTHLLALNNTYDDREQVMYIIEDFKQRTDNKTLSRIIKTVKAQFASDPDILTCCLFGSYARGAASRESDVDLLFVVRDKSHERNITKKLSPIGTLLALEFSPIVMDEHEFAIALKTKEPALVTLLAPSQRIVLTGIEYFLRKTRTA